MVSAIFSVVMERMKDRDFADLSKIEYILGIPAGVLS
jgi:hypothetical protein